MDHRAKKHLKAAQQLYPNAVAVFEELRTQKGQGIPSWPDWCLMPLAAMHAHVESDAGIDLNTVGDVSRLTALLTWRYTQGIYRFDPSVYSALIDTPVTREIPTQVLERMPEWAVYIETPGMTFDDHPMHGFFAHLEYDVNDHRQELRFLLDLDAEHGPLLLPVPVHLGGGLADGIAKASTEAQRQAWRTKQPQFADAIRAPDLTSAIAPLVSLLLYLCADEADFGAHRPQKPTPRKGKKGKIKLFAATQPKAWDCAVRLGAAIRAAESQNAEPTGQSGSRKRPHMRRAHWHSFWIGRRDSDDRNLIVRWVPPIAVNLTDDELPAVIKPVEPIKNG